LAPISSSRAAHRIAEAFPAHPAVSDALFRGCLGIPACLRGAAGMLSVCVRHGDGAMATQDRLAEPRSALQQN
jgi:hypothetical protein